MLQCSNYKAANGLEKIAFCAGISRSFYQMPNPGAARACIRRYLRMEYFAGPVDLRGLLSLATKLRQLANDTLCRGDQALYLLTAEALEKRAEWLAATLPLENNEQPSDPKMHTPVDVII